MLLPPFLPPPQYTLHFPNKIYLKPHRKDPEQKTRRQTGCVTMMATHRRVSFQAIPNISADGLILLQTGIPKKALPAPDRQKMSVRKQLKLQFLIEPGLS